MRNGDAQKMRNIGVFDLSDRRMSPARTTTAHPLPCLRRACPADLRRNGRALFPQARCGKRLGRFRLTRPLGRHAAGGGAFPVPPRHRLPFVCGWGLGLVGSPQPTPGGRPHPLWWKRGGSRYRSTRPLGVASSAGGGEGPWVIASEGTPNLHRHHPPVARGRGRYCRRRGLARGHGPDFQTPPIPCAPCATAPPSPRQPRAATPPPSLAALRACRASPCPACP